MISRSPTSLFSLSNFWKPSGTVTDTPREISPAGVTNASLEHAFLFTAQLGKIFCHSCPLHHATDFQKKFAKANYTILVFNTDKQVWLWNDFVRRLLCMSVAVSLTCLHRMMGTAESWYNFPEVMGHSGPVPSVFFRKLM